MWVLIVQYRSWLGRVWSEMHHAWPGLHRARGGSGTVRCQQRSLVVTNKIVTLPRARLKTLLWTEGDLDNCPSALLTGREKLALRLLVRRQLWAGHLENLVKFPLT
jgi:hypothetical protein